MTRDCNGPQVAPVFRALGLCVLALWQASGPAAQAAGLRERFEVLRARPAAALVTQTVYLESTESADALQGQVFALVDHPFALVRQALAAPEPWCEVLILHLNVKYCRVGGVPGQAVLDAGLGRKFDQPLSEVHWLHLSYRLVSADEQQFSLALVSDQGPMGTRDYRIEFEAVPYGDQQTLLHLRYGYGFALTARWAMQLYLATLGRDKPGFSVLGTGPDGRPRRVGGVRGVLERNTVRYYLAVEAHLGVQTLPVAQRQARRLLDWFDATERYAEQLHELSREDYLSLKRRELARQQSQAWPAAPN